MDTEIFLLRFGNGINGDDAFQTVEHSAMPHSTVHHEDIPLRLWRTGKGAIIAPNELWFTDEHIIQLHQYVANRCHSKT